MTTWWVSVPTTLAVVLVTCVGCGDDGGGDSAVERAQAKVTAKEKAVTDAQEAAAEAAAAFCGDSKTYIVALDRYGDLLTSTTPTVGDVTDAGSELDEPGDDVTAAAEAAVAAQDQVREAKSELKEARAELAEVQASGSSSPGKSEQSGSAGAKPTATPPPLPPAESVNRVKQAQSELEATQAGINDQTPLVQASQQFNAAAVALEMSWLQLYSAAGCLTDGQQEDADAAVADYTSVLQQALAEAGYYQGAVDGIYGPGTVDAVEALQKAHGLPVTGAVDKATEAALETDLQAKGGAAAAEALATTAAVQQTLKLAGFWDGPVDGQWTPELTDAVKAFQRELGVDATGTVDAATVAGLEDAIDAAREPESPGVTTAPPTDSESTDPSPTDPATES